MAGNKTIGTDIDSLWQRWEIDRSDEAREQLILAFSPLVKFVAARVGASLPRSVDHGDLMSYGTFGLIDAVERFERSRGFKFETFAIPRIKGAILDELRAMDWVPRSVRTKARAIERAMSELESSLGRTPTDDEVAGALDISVETLHNRLGEVSAGGVTALDELRPSGEGDSVTLRDLLADRGAGPGDQLEDKETRRMLGHFVNSLGEREKAVLTLYYFEGLTMADIGDVFGVSESRVCQIHAKAVLQLRGKFTAAAR